MLAQAGHAGWASLPAGNTLELIEAKSSGTAPHKELLELADRYAALLILGQTLTSTTPERGGGTRAQGEVHDGVLRERLEALARWVGDILSYQLAPAICRLNYGDDDECPVIAPDFVVPEKPTDKAQRLQLVSQIVPVSKAWLAEQLGVPLEEEEGGRQKDEENGKAYQAGERPPGYVRQACAAAGCLPVYCDNRPPLQVVKARGAEGAPTLKDVAAALAGLTGTPYDSGQSRRDQGISKVGNKRVRWVMVQLAWAWLRFQPESALTKWFGERFGHGSARQRRVGIVALARKLLVALWRYQAQDQVPVGAVLKPA